MPTPESPTLERSFWFAVEPIYRDETTGTDGAAAWAELIDELLRLRKMPDDWDGAGAVAPPPPLTDAAIRLAQQFQASEMPPADRVIAGVNGTIFFEWHPSHGYAEFEVTSPTEGEGRLVNPRTGETISFGPGRLS